MKQAFKFISPLTKSTPALLGFAFLFFYFQLDVPSIFSKYFGVYDPKEIPAFAFLDFYTLIWFFLIPIMTNKLIFNESLKEMYLGLPKNKLSTTLLISLALLFIMPYIIFCAKQTSFQGYSLGIHTFPKYTFIAVFLFPLYYLGEEFFFRGFLFLGLWKRVRWHSFWITDLLFTLSHFGKPGLEVLLCIPITIILNSITLYSKSIYPAVIIHSCAGVMLSAIVTFG